jgi:hypothetical protein
LSKVRRTNVSPMMLSLTFNPNRAETQDTRRRVVATADVSWRMAAAAAWIRLVLCKLISVPWRRMGREAAGLPARRAGRLHIVLRFSYSIAGVLGSIFTNLVYYYGFIVDGRDGSVLYSGALLDLRDQIIHSYRKDVMCSMTFPAHFTNFSTAQRTTYYTLSQANACWEGHAAAFINCFCTPSLQRVACCRAVPAGNQTSGERRGETITAGTPATITGRRFGTRK